MTSASASLSFNKRAVTEMVAYVALIIIAFGISVLLYSYLQLNAPKERPACPEGVSLAVQDASCLIKPKLSGTKSDLTITLTNNGRRTLSGAYIRLGTIDQKVKGLLNENKIFFPATTESPESAALAPGQSIIQRYQGGIAGSAVGSYALEVEPVVGVPGSLALCENAIVTKTIECLLPALPGGVPQYIKGSYILPKQTLERQEARTVARLEAGQLEAASHLEVYYYQKIAGAWKPYDPPKSEEYEESYSSPYTTYTNIWSNIPTGEYKVEGFMVFFNGDKYAKVPIKDDTYGTSREFAVRSCIGYCERTNDGSFLYIKDRSGNYLSSYGVKYRQCRASSITHYYCIENGCVYEGDAGTWNAITSSWESCFSYGSCYNEENIFELDGNKYSVGSTCMPSVQVNVDTSHSGLSAGTIASSPAGINCHCEFTGSYKQCSGQCSASFPAGLTITFTATPDTGSSFTQWSGACSGTSSDKPCVLKADSEMRVGGAFNKL